MKAGQEGFQACEYELCDATCQTSQIPTEETFHHTVNINFVFLCGFPGYFNLKDPFELVEKTKLKCKLSQEITTE